MTIPFLDLGRVNRPHIAALGRAAARVLASGRYVLGPEVAQFERAWADVCGVQHAVGVGNGLDALTLTLRAWHLPPGSEVIVPAHTFVASVLAVYHAGLTPVLADVDPTTFLLTADRAEAALTPRTRVLMPVHLYGRPCPLAPLRALARQYGLRLLADGAQAHGALYGDQPLSVAADATTFSFYPVKNLGALGDGGAVVTDDDALAQQLRRWRNYGSPEKYQYDVVGYNSRLDELQAAILTEKLPYLAADTARRQALARRYVAGIRHPAVTLPPADQLRTDAWHLFVVQHPQRDRFRAYLAGRGIGTEVHYPVAIHRQPAFPALRSTVAPVAEQLARTVLSLPLNPALTDAEADYVVAAINQCPERL